MKQITLFIGFFHSPFYFPIRQNLVPVYIYLMDLNFLFLIHINIDDHLVLMGQVIGLFYVHLCILKTLFLEMFFDNRRGTIHYIGSYLVSLDQPQAHFQIFPLTFLNPVVIYFRNTRLLFQLYFEPCLIAISLRPLNHDIGKQTLPPKFFGSLGNGITGYFDNLSYFQPRVTYQYIILIIGSPGNRDTGNLIFLRNGRINDLRIIYRIEFLFILCGHSLHTKRQKQKNSQTFQRHIISHFQSLFLHL